MEDLDENLELESEIWAEQCPEEEDESHGVDTTDIKYLPQNYGIVTSTVNELNGVVYKSPSPRKTKYLKPSDFQANPVDESSSEEVLISRNTLTTPCRYSLSDLKPIDNIYHISDASQYLSLTTFAETVHNVCTLANGSRYFVRTRIPKNDHSNIKFGNLLEKPMKELQLEALAVERNLKSNQEKLHNEKEDFESLFSMETSSPINHKESYRSESTDDLNLWVDKYSPKLFSQLLSPEQVNREVLKSLKAWDSFVFRREKKTKANDDDDDDLGMTAHDSKKSMEETGEDDGDSDRDNEDEEQDRKFRKSQLASGKSKGRHQDPRPLNKVILLCGAPGTGKTTLAHVLATHCGYHPLEVNSSDDRSVDFMRDILMKGTQSRTLASDNRPNCLILDEIDGIDGRGPIDFLLSVIKAPLQSGQGVGGKKKGGSGESGSFPLTKPLICICNDQFVPALRELRKFAQVFVLGPPAESRLVQRLRVICGYEGINISPMYLTALIRATGGDIRSCINTLQFAVQRIVTESGRNGQRNGVNDKGVSKNAAIGRALGSMLASGLKDEQRDVFQIWREILCRKELVNTIQKKRMRFQQLQSDKSALALPDNSNSRNSNNSNKSSQKSQSSQPKKNMNGECLNELLSSITEYGDNPLVLKGAFENIFKLRYPDATFIKTQAASEWLSTADLIMGNLKHGDSSAYQTLVYLPVTVAALHFIVAGDQKADITYPTQDRDAATRYEQRWNILRSMMQTYDSETHIRPSIRQLLCSPQVIARDVVSYLMDLILPKVRAVPYLSMTSVERDSLAAAVRVMMACGLTYNSVATLDSTAPSHAFGTFGGRLMTSQLQLEPAIDQLVMYAHSADGVRKGRNGVPYQDKTMELNQVVSERVTRFRSLSGETRSLILSELRKLIIQSRAVKADESPIGSSLPQFKSMVGTAKLQLVKKSEPKPTEVLPPEPVVKPEVIKALANAPKSSGRMDFFCKKLPNESKKRVHESNAPSGLQPIPKENDSSVTNGGSTGQPNNVDSTKSSKKPKLFYKFNQGYSNAVRRPVNISEFL